jgi:hypothetical protein
VVYEGLNKTDYAPEKQLFPVEVLKFDWNGNLLCDYQLPQYVYAISVDSKEEYLYATTRVSAMDAAYMVRYKL